MSHAPADDICRIMDGWNQLTQEDAEQDTAEKIEKVSSACTIFATAGTRNPASNVYHACQPALRQIIED